MIVYALFYCLGMFVYAINRMLPASSFGQWPEGVTTALTNFGSLVAGVADILPAGGLAAIGASMAFIAAWKLWIIPLLFGRTLANRPTAATDDPDVLGAWEQDQREQSATAVFIGQARQFAEAEDEEDNDFEV